MSKTLIAASPTPQAGNTTEPLPWGAPRYADPATYLELGAVTNLALREVLTHYAVESHPELCLSETIPGVVVLRRSLDRSVDQRIRLFVCGDDSELRPNAHVLRWMASTGQLLQTAGPEELVRSLQSESERSQPTPSADEHESVAPTRSSDVVDVVAWLAAQLGVPDGDILAAAKIKRRNWHNWKAGRRPRLESQGELWALLNTVKTLSDIFDGNAASWFAEGGQVRRDLLTTGKHRKLVSDALLDISQRGELSTESRRRRRKQSAAGYFE